MRDKQKFLFIFILLAFLIITLVPEFVSAKKTLGDAAGALDTALAPTGIEKTEVTSLAGQVVKGILSGVGIIFFVLMVYAGVRWMTARGDEEKATKARETIISATIGIIVIVGAYALTTFITDRIVKGNTSGSVTDEAIESTGEGPKICCIVPTSAGSGIFTASMRTSQECKEISEDGASGMEWGMYEVANFGQCAVIFNCWDNPDGSYSINFNQCMKKITGFEIITVQ